jgi:hypothetical protein
LSVGGGLKFRVVDDFDDRWEFRVKENRQSIAHCQGNEEVDDEGAHGLEGGNDPSDAIEFKGITVRVIWVHLHPEYLIAGKDPIAIPFKGDLRAIAFVVLPSYVGISRKDVADIVGGSNFASHL